MPPGAIPVDPPCLTDELLAELVDGRLSSQELARVHEHAARCKECFELLIAVARGGLSQEALHEPPAEPLSARWTPPEEFHEFRLVRQLGLGAMGVVYLAHDRSLDRQVAVKFIAAPQPEARARERFLTEARAIARLKHANVVTVFRVGEIEGHPYIVSEYLVGHSLAQLALPLPWRRALGLGIGLARGLAAAHRQGVLHRDLKPDNVFLTAEGEVKLLDFGLAELVDTNAPLGPSGKRTPAGTPRYMAPELFTGVSATPRSDLYALGLVLHELCTGKLPPRQTAGQDHEPRLSEQIPGIAPEFASIIERCLHTEPEERFASAEALCAELELLEPLHESEALPAGNPYRGLAPFEAEHRALFFGRDADIRAVIERLRRQPLVLVAGDSGVGKSSLCRAGILPRIARGAIDEYRDFSTLTLEPGRRPVAVLAAALAPVLGQPEAELAARLTAEQEWLGPALRKAYQGRRGLLLFVDQLEELVTVSEPGEASRFASLLGELALPSAGVHVLLAVRGDFLTRVGALPGLGDAVERALYLLRPLTPDGVREAIVGPARSRGVVFESEALLQTLAGATAQGAGSLPLLQFTLAELWERRDSARRCITQAALDEMGGVAGALSRHADGVLARLDQPQQQAARRLLGRLITAEGTRGERGEDELTSDSAEARAALRALIEGRLLHARTEAGRSSYEIAHEALIQSWGTLRQWIDEDAGQRALRQRIEEAAAEWERLGRTDELLWRQRQLDEARALETTALGERDQAFLDASRRVLRRQRLLRWASVFLLVFGGGGLFGRPLVQAYLTQLFVSARLEDARTALVRWQDLQERASKSRERALPLFDGHDPGNPEAPIVTQELWLRANTVWRQSLAELKQAHAAAAEAEQALKDALARAPDQQEARRLLINLTFERIVLAERFHRKDERDQLMPLFNRLAAGDPKWQGSFDTRAELEIWTQPPGAKAELTRYVEHNGVLQRQRVPDQDWDPHALTPISPKSLPAGSYHVRLTLAGHEPVDLPLQLERGERTPINVRLPTHVPEGYAYVPPGCFLSGSADSEELREFLLSAPLHHYCLPQGYVIGRREVTLGDWLEYLKTLSRGAPDRSLLETKVSEIGGTALQLLQLPDGQWQLTLSLPEGEDIHALEGQPIRYPGRSLRAEQDWRRFPLVGVSAEKLKGYLDWLRSRKLPGARLCHEQEWERAARGADDRRFPHGNELQKEDANIDATYQPLRNASGPDEVGSHPTSASPFGLLDMAGNAIELTQSTSPGSDGIMLRGGAWAFGEYGALIANRQKSTPTLRDPRIGVRVCADFPVQ